MNAFEKIKAVIANTEKDAGSFYQKGNKTAGTRLRRAFLEVKQLASVGRSEVTELKKNN